MKKATSAARAKARQLAFQAFRLAPQHKLGKTWALSTNQRRILMHAMRKDNDVWLFVFRHWPVSAERSIKILLQRGFLVQTGPTTLQLTQRGATALQKYHDNSMKYKRPHG